jgi:CHAT domain-containing protein/tetratricopeptide (TPR) repeat protein
MANRLRFCFVSDSTRYRIRERAPLIAGLLLLLFTALITHAHEHTAAKAVKAVPQNEDLRQLPPGHFISRDIAIGEAHSYPINLAAGEYIHLLVREHRGLNLRITLFDPRGQEMISLGDNPDHIEAFLSLSSTLKSEALSYVSVTGGTYRLQLMALETYTPGSYELELNELRTASEQDRRHCLIVSLFTEGEWLRAQTRDAAAQTNALLKLEQALAGWKTLGDIDGEAQALNSIGIVYCNLLEKEKAVSNFGQALARWEQTGNLRGAAVALNNLGKIYYSDEQALSYLERALDCWQRAGDRRWEAITLFYLGRAHSYLPSAEKAPVYFEQALRVWETVDDRTWESFTLSYMADYYQWLGDRSKALEYYNRGLQQARNSSFLEEETNVLLRLGELYFADAEYSQALDFYYQALVRSRNSNLPAEAYTLFDLGKTYLSFGEREKALDFLLQALPRWKQNVNGEAYTLEGVGKIYQLNGEWQKALEYYHRALPLMRATRERHGESVVHNDLGSVYLSQGDSAEALDEYQQVLGMSHSASYQGVEAQTLLNLGHLYEKSGEAGTLALNYYHRALDLFRAMGDPRGEAGALYDIAHIESNEGRLDEASDHLERALTIIESIRHNITSEELRQSYSATIQQQYELYIDVMMRRHREHSLEGYDRRALQASERARARNLLDALHEVRANIVQGVDPALLERERQLRGQLNALAARQMRLLGSNQQRPQEIESLAGEINWLTTESEQVRALIRSRSPRYAALIEPQPLTLAQIQADVLAPDTLLLEYELGEERSYLWAVTQTSLFSYELPARKEIETLVRRVRELMIARQPVREETLPQYKARIARADEQYNREAARLSAMLLDPVKERLGNSRLLVVSDGALQYLPLAALPDPAANAPAENAEPLIVKHEIVMLPSASVLANLRWETAGRAPAPSTVAVLADPVFDTNDSRIRSLTMQARTVGKDRGQSGDLDYAVRDVGPTLQSDGTLPRLPFTREEAEVIARAAPSGTALKAVDFKANRALATSAELAQYRIVHFATHGLLDTVHPALSGIVLSLVDEQRKPQDGFLRLQDIYNLHLPAELVVLSACQTGLGKEVRGEGLVGLTRGFMYAGAKRVMASLWKVNDNATAELMKRFYEAVLIRQQSPSAALREAQIAMWRQRQWQSPYYWAGFVLQGEYR